MNLRARPFDIDHFIATIEKNRQITALNVKNFKKKLHQLNFSDEEDVSKFIMIVLNMGVHFRTANLHKPRHSAADDPSRHPNVLMHACCWIDTLPHLGHILSFIKNYQLNHSTTKKESKAYIESDIGYFHTLFMFYLLMHSITIKYILSHYQLYSVAFDICMHLFHILYIKNDFGVMKMKPKTKEEEEMDARFRDCLRTGKVPDGLPSIIPLDIGIIFEEGTETSRDLAELFNESFISTAFYWKQRHWKYLCEEWNFTKFIKEDVTKRLLQRGETISFSKGVSWGLFIGRTVHLMISWCHVINAFKYVDYRKRSNETYLRKLFHIWFNDTLEAQLSSNHPANAHKVQIRSYWRAAVYVDDFRELMDKFMSNPCSPFSGGIKKRMIELIEVDKKQRNEKEFGDYEMNYNEGRGCCNPQCDKTKWSLDHVHYRTLPDEKKNREYQKYIKRPFKRCKRCRVAVYCSKLCQKRHWNLYEHKAQCIAICKISNVYM